MTIQVGNSTAPASSAQLLALAEAIGIASLPFNPIIPLRYAAAQMPRINVNTSIVFAPGVNPVAGATCICTLISDGVNVPLFSGMTKLNTSYEYVKDTGTRNIVQFYFDGEVVWYAIMQASGTVVVAPAPGPAPAPTPAPAPAPAPGATAPGAPTSVVATAGVTSASVSFAAPASNGGSAILDFTATLSTGQTATGTASPIVVSGLPAGTAVTAAVRARNSVGLGVASTASNSVTPTAAAPAPSGTTLLRVDVASRGANLSETGDTTAGFTYFATNQGGQFAASDTGSVASPAMTGAGIFRVRCGDLAGNGFGIIGLSRTATPGAYPTWDFALVQNTSGFQPFALGVSAGDTAGPTPVAHTTEYQMRRTGTTVYAETTDGTIIKTWTGVTGTLYMNGSVYGGGGLEVLRLIA